MMKMGILGAGGNGAEHPAVSGRGLSGREAGTGLSVSGEFVRKEEHGVQRSKSSCIMDLT